MKGITILVCFFGLFTQLPQLKLQSQSETFAKKTEAGFADAVSDTLERMQGKWTIKSASLLGADLPLDQFELLTVDKDGFTLDVQKRKTQFAFAEFKLESKTLIAKCVSPGYRDGLAYEISFSDELVKIRYRTNGAHIPPVPTDDDKQLLVQSWKKSQTE